VLCITLIHHSSAALLIIMAISSAVIEALQHSIGLQVVVASCVLFAVSQPCASRNYLSCVLTYCPLVPCRTGDLQPVLPPSQKLSRPQTLGCVPITLRLQPIDWQAGQTRASISRKIWRNHTSRSRRSIVCK